VEFLLISFVPWLFLPREQYLVYDPAFSAFVLLVFVSAGALVGALAGAALFLSRKTIGRFPTAPAICFRTAGIGTLVLALGLNAAASSDLGALKRVFICGTAVALLGVLSVSMVRPNWRLDFIVNPWVVCGLLIFPYWLDHFLDRLQFGTREVRLLLFAVTLFAVPALSYLFRRKRQTMALYPFRALGMMAILGAAALGVSSRLSTSPLTGLVTAQADGTAPASGRPNVILIVMDTVRADHLSVYGYKRETTPNLRRLAAVSTVFTRAISTADMTLPSHASMFTGIYASHHGAYPSRKHPAGAPLSGEFPTLAELLAQNGYHTMGIAANTGFFGSSFQLEQGFAHFDCQSPRLMFARVPSFFLRPWLLTGGLVLSVFPDAEKVTLGADEINRKALAVLSERPRHLPFFLFLNYMDAHYPYLPPHPFDRMFPGKIEGWSGSRYLALRRAVARSAKPAVGREALDHLNSQYDGGIAYLDAQLGMLLRELRRMGLFKNSLIVITSDHGEGLGERNRFGHGGVSVHHGLIGVPLIIKYPGSTKAAVSNDPVSLIDLLPTVMDALNLPAPKRVEGRSLLQSGREPAIIAESFLERPFPSPSIPNAHRAIIAGPFKLIVTASGGKELYHLDKDPAETRNRYNGADPIAQQLAFQLARWTRSAAPYAESIPAPLDRNALDKLRSLGYVQ
jgi:arylsulfatase A-like enzyme